MPLDKEMISYFQIAHSTLLKREEKKKWQTAMQARTNSFPVEELFYVTSHSLHFGSP